MNTVKIALELPKDIYLALQSAGLNRADLELRATRDFAVQLFADGRLSLGKAAQLAGMTRYTFWNYLVEKNVPAFQYTEEDFENDQAMIQDWISKQQG